MKQTLNVTGMHCEGCENRIQKMVSKLEGVDEVKADRNSENVELVYDGSANTLQAVKDKIGELGYTAE